MFRNSHHLAFAFQLRKHRVHSMQGICWLSRRWHQTFRNSPSFGHHSQCPQAVPPIRTYRQSTRSVRKTRRDAVPNFSQIENPSELETVNPFSPSQLLSRKGDDLVVREFEQYGSDKSTQQQIDPEQEARDEVEGIWAEIQDIDRQIEIARQGPFGPQSEFMAQFPKEKREEILQALAKEGVLPNSEEDALDVAEIDRLMDTEHEDDALNGDDLAVTLHIPKAHQALVGHFNKALKASRESIEDTLKSLNLWKWYLRCQQKIPDFSRIVSEVVWQFLWKSQSQLGTRQSHLVMLGRDMIAAGEGMSDEQCLEYVKALDISGDSATALSTWEETKAQLHRDPPAEFLTDFFGAGVKLYTSIGRPQKAQTVALSAIQRGADPSILVHVVSGWAASKTPFSSSKAWAMYLNMRSLLGDKMSPGMYESVSDSFLESRHSQMALAVFKDMISRVRGTGTTTLESYQQALGRTELGADPDEVAEAINQVSLTMLLTLPKEFHNKYFFASWIKKLLGQQRIDAASQVVDLMYERNIRPDAIHLNGIIGAWLRDKSPQARERAEKLALEMIQARINQMSRYSQNVSLEDFRNTFRKIIPLQEKQNSWLNPIHLERPVPAANTETFSLLFEYNEERNRWQEFSRLTEIMLGPAQLKPNNFIMNKWLASELRARSFFRFWALYNDLKHTITPNLETYSLAWQVVTSQQSTSGGKSEFSHRQLFAELMRWSQKLTGRSLRIAKGDFEPGFYNQVVRSFSFRLDIPGTICALQGMYDAFGVTPDDVSIQLITGQAARILPKTNQSQTMVGGRRRANVKLSPNQTTLKAIADVASTLEMKHKLDMVESGEASAEEVEDINSHASRKIRFNVMIEFLMIVLEKTKTSTDNPAKALRDVAKVMHVNIEHINIEAYES